jgi:hypothetical protein
VRCSLPVDKAVSTAKRPTGDDRRGAGAVDQIPIGTVDAELKVCRIRLLRAMKAKELIDVAPNDPSNEAGMVVTTVTQSQKSGKRGKYAESEQFNEVLRSRTDYDAIIERFLGRIGTRGLIRASGAAQMRSIRGL